MLRDAAKAVLLADITNVRADLATRGVGDRIADRVSDSAIGVFHEAIEVADNNKGALAALVGAIVLWFARHPIMSLFTGDHMDEDRDNQSDDAERSSSAVR